MYKVDTLYYMKNHSFNGNGNREMISKSFSYGANDALRSLYKRYLIVERVKAILGKMQS